MWVPPSTKNGSGARSGAVLPEPGSSLGSSGKRTPRFTISKGAFHTLVKNGGLTLFTLSGHFVTSSTASVRLNIPATCDGSNKVYTLARQP